MASVFKPNYLLPIPAGAVRRKPKGRPAVVEYVDRLGRKHVHPIKLDAAGNEAGSMVCEQGRWWMKYSLPDGTIRREKGFRDKVATEQEAARREREAAQAGAGVLSVDTEQLSAPLERHIEAFIADLERAGRSQSTCGLLDGRLRAMMAACGWGTLRQITPDSMSHYLAALKREGRASKTSNEHLAAAKNFCNWCIKSRRLAGNPLACVSKTEHGEPVYQRRALTPEQAVKLLDVAGPRRLVYLTAMYTGLRRSELRQLQWGDLRIGQDEKTPHVALRASTTKARRADTLPLRADLAGELRRAMPTDVKPQDRVFPRVPKMPRFKADLKLAGIDHIDSGGRVVDFHSLRVTFGTMLAKAGAAPRVAMELLRHSDMRLTMMVYTDPRILDTSRAVADLPTLNRPTEKNRQQAVARLNGTDNLPVQGPTLTIAQNRGFECPAQSHFVPLADSGHKKTPDLSGVFIGAERFELSTS